jgi:hypothetical protein
MTSEGTRGGLSFGHSLDEVRGRLTKEYLDEGHSVSILEVVRLSNETIAQIARLAAGQSLNGLAQGQSGEAATPSEDANGRG